MTIKQIRSRFALAFFIVWLGILYAGADHPPPRGFIWVILFDLVAAYLVYLRVPTYFNWLKTAKRFRLLRVLLDGLVAGTVFAIFPLIFNPDPQPEMGPPGMVDMLIWFTVLALMGSLNTLFLYFCGFITSRFTKNSAED